MKKMVLSLMVSAFVGMSASYASATDHNHDVVRDFQDNIVKNTFNNCVVTKWKSGYDTCDHRAIPAVEKQPEIRSELLNVYFNFDSDTITVAEERKLQRVVELLKSSSQVDSVDIVGYADYIGDYQYNRALSRDRANAVRSCLQTKGYLNTRDVSTEALGEGRPVVNCDDGVSQSQLKACLWRDRRVEIRLNYVK